MTDNNMHADRWPSSIDTVYLRLLLRPQVLKHPAATRLKHSSSHTHPTSFLKAPPACDPNFPQSWRSLRLLPLCTPSIPGRLPSGPESNARLNPLVSIKGRSHLNFPACVTRSRTLDSRKLLITAWVMVITRTSWVCTKQTIARTLEAHIKVKYPETIASDLCNN
jgi:hypothetical protein